MIFQSVRLMNFMSYQDETFSDLNDPALVLIEGCNLDEGGSNGAGKCFAKGASVLMYNGTVRPVEDVRVGDTVMGPDSTARLVTSLGRGREEMYEIAPTKGDSFQVNGSHILTLRYCSSRGSFKKGQVRNLSVLEYLKLPSDHKRLLMLYRSECVTFPVSISLPVDPYFLGAWLGDGTSHATAITTMDAEIRNAFTAEADRFDLVTKMSQKPNNKACTYRASAKSGESNKLFEALVDLDVIGNKSIPYAYLTSDRKSRLSLLAGIVDTDGFYGNGYLEVFSKFDRLTSDILFLCRSLGFAAYAKKKNIHGKFYNRISICGDLTQIPLRLARKIPATRKINKSALHTGFAVSSVGEGDFFGFTVNLDHLFLLGDFTVVHNSSLWDGISWCLFGQTMRGLKNDQVVHRKFKKDCHVKVKLLLGDDVLTVTRYRADKKHLNSLYVETSDGERKEFGTLSQTQEWLLKTVGIDFELFRCTILFAQGETFNFVNAGNKQQKEILAKVMRLSFDRALEKAKDAVNLSAKTILKTSEDIRTLDSHLVVDIESSLDEEIETWDRRHKEKLANYRDSLTEKIAEINALVRPKELDLKAHNEAFDAYDEAREASKKAHMKAMEFKARIRVATEELKKASSSPDTCGSCGQALDNSKSKAMATKLQAELEGFKEKHEEAGRKAVVADAKLEAIEAVFETYKTAATAMDRFNEMSERMLDHMKELKAILDRAKAEENPYHAMRDEAVAKQKKIEAKIKDKKKELKELEEEHAYLKFWVTAFGDGGIKSFVFDLVCSTLTNKANNYLNVLTNGSVSISFDTQTALKSGEVREKFDCQIITDGERVAYEAYSGGEKRRISLAVDLALSDLMSDYYATKFNIVIFDEQDTYLDDNGRRSFLKLLQDLSRTKRVFVVAHDGEFKAKFDEVITIEKKDGVSKVV